MASWCSSYVRLYESPARLRHGSRALAAVSGRRVVGRARDHAPHDALRDGGQAEHGEGHVEAPVRDARAPGATAVGGEILLLGRDAESLQVLAQHAAQDVR